jgi:hypothetical protein
VILQVSEEPLFIGD